MVVKKKSALKATEELVQVTPGQVRGVLGALMTVLGQRARGHLGPGRAPTGDREQ